MIGGFKNIAKIPELQKKILFTFFLLAVYRIGAHVPTPGIDTQALAAFFEQARNSLLGLFDVFAGGCSQQTLCFCPGNYALYQCIHYPSAADGCRSSPRKVV